MNKVRDVKQLTPTWPVIPAAKEQEPKHKAKKKASRKRRRRNPDDGSREPSKHIDEYV